MEFLAHPSPFAGPSNSRTRALRSGIAEPSQADELITRRVKDALELVDIRLLDHIIIGDGMSVSLAERGAL